MSADLANFLLQRIAEDEAAAQAAILPQYGQTGEWLTFDDKEHLSRTTVFASNGGDRLGQACETEMSWIGRAARDHIARWDPARVLAECEAKRRIVDGLLDAERAVATYDHAHPTDAYWQEWGNRHALALAVELLALPYSDHPDYDPSWRP